MKCKNIRRRIHRCVDGECGSEREKALVEIHLSECAECRQYHDGILSLRALIRGVGAIEAGEIPVARLLEGFRERRDGMKGAHGFPGGVLVNRFVPAAAVLAAVLLMAVSLRIIKGDGIDPVKQYLLYTVGNREVLYLTANEWMFIPE